MANASPEPKEEPWPPVAEILAAHETIPEGLIVAFLDALGCNEHTLMEAFEAFSGKDIAEANDSQAVKAVGSPIQRALLFKLCKDLAIL